MSVIAKVEEFEKMNAEAERLGLLLSCRSVSKGGCQWRVKYTLTKDSAIICEVEEAWRIQDFLVAYDFLLELVAVPSASVN